MCLRKNWHGSVLLRRKSTIPGKEANIFTTNVDVFLEKALEDLGLAYNDGFNGRFKPSFRLSNFKKSRFRKSLHYDNIAEIPVFNLLKLHGSLCWDLHDNDGIVFSSDLGGVITVVSKPLLGATAPRLKIIASYFDSALTRTARHTKSDRSSTKMGVPIGLYSYLL